MEIIASLPRHSDFVFSFDGEQPVHGYSRPKTALDQRMQQILGTVESWVLHDIRRTCATGMAELGIAPHVLDRVLNHTSGTIRGVAKIYNRAEYKIERQEALDAWGRFVEALVYPDRARRNVVDLPRPVAAT